MFKNRISVYAACAVVGLLWLPSCEPAGAGGRAGDPPPCRLPPCEHACDGRDCPVGPGQPRASLHDVSWDTARPSGRLTGSRPCLAATRAAVSAQIVRAPPWAELHLSVDDLGCTS